MPWERAKDVGGLGGLNTSLERMGKVKQHTKTTGHDINTVHPDYASILQTAIKTKGKRLFLESLHSFLDKISLNWFQSPHSILSPLTFYIISPILSLVIIFNNFIYLVTLFFPPTCLLLRSVYLNFSIAQLLQRHLPKFPCLLKRAFHKYMYAVAPFTFMSIYLYQASDKFLQPKGQNGIPIRDLPILL